MSKPRTMDEYVGRYAGRAREHEEDGVLWV